MCVLILYISGGTYSLKSTPNDRFLWAAFHGNFFYSQKNIFLKLENNFYEHFSIGTKDFIEIMKFLSESSTWNWWNNATNIAKISAIEIIYGNYDPIDIFQISFVCCSNFIKSKILICIWIQTKNLFVRLFHLLLAVPCARAVPATKINLKEKRYTNIILILKQFYWFYFPLSRWFRCTGLSSTYSISL